MIPIAIGIVLPRLNDAVGQGTKFVVADSLVLPCLLEAVRLEIPWWQTTFFRLSVITIFCDA